MLGKTCRPHFPNLTDPKLARAMDPSLLHHPELESVTFTPTGKQNRRMWRKQIRPKSEVNLRLQEFESVAFTPTEKQIRRMWHKQIRPKSDDI